MPDPHRWLRDVESEKVKAWVAQQDAATDAFMAQREELPRIRAFLERNHIAVDPLWFEQRGARRFTLTRKPGLDQPVLTVTESGRETVLLDPNPAKLAIRNEEVRVSPSGRFVALLVSPPGQVLGAIRVIDGATGATLEESPTCTVMPLIAWHPREQGFYYSLCRKLFEDEHAQRDGLYWHALSTAWASDRCVKQYHDGPGHIAHATIAGEHIVLATRQFSSGESGYALCPLPEDPCTAPHTAVELFSDLEGYIDYLGLVDGELYFHTCVGAPNGRIVAIEPKRPARTHWRDAVREGGLAIARPERFGGPPKAAVSTHGLLITVVDHAHDALRFYGPDGALRDAPELPELSTVDGIFATADGFSVYTQSFIAPRVVHEYRDGALKERSRVTMPDVDPSRYELRQEFITARDGTKVPMYLLHARGLARDGVTPTLLYGYGGFGQSITPEYSPLIAAWLSLGGIYALANIRGGGEYGQSWAHAGSGLNKQTSFNDFYDCAESLIAQRYTSKEHLVGRGLSNGGLLTATCANQRPDLWAALATEVPLVDMLGLGDSSTGRAVAAEYGNPVESRESFDVMRAYSPLHNIRSDVRTPPQFVVAAELDIAAQPQQIYPYVAARQEAVAASGMYAPVLLRLVRGEGHNDWRPAVQRSMLAEEIAFLHHFATLGTKAQLRQLRDVRVPMRDGVTLSANVWLPAPRHAQVPAAVESSHERRPSRERAPTVLLRTPYDNDAIQFERLGLRAYVEAGYAVVFQMVRGRGASQGRWNFFFAEGDDGHDSVEWIAQQPWCNGKVAMDGGSYLGTAQWLAARERPEHLEAILPAVPAGDWFHEIPYVGGALQVDWAFAWLGMLAGISFDFDATGDKNLEKYRPLREAGRVLGADMDIYKDILAHPTPDDAFWSPLRLAPGDYAKLETPVFTVTGWFDGDQAGTLHYWQQLRRHNPKLSAQLTIGPWDHAQCYLGGTPTLREMQFGADSVLPIRDLRLAFLNQHLRGVAATGRSHTAQVFITGSDRWHALDDYPPKVDAQRWHLGAGRTLSTQKGSGAPDTFTFDPKDPVPYRPGAADHRELATRADVLCYTSETLREPLTVLGLIEAVIFAASDAPDTDFTAKLLDVHPDGRAINLTHVGGVLRASFRDGKGQAPPLKPGVPEEFRIRLSHSGHTFLPGHRIRLEVSSSNFPLADPNPNTGENPFDATTTRIAKQSIHHDAQHPSHLLLPVWSA